MLIVINGVVYNPSNDDVVICFKDTKQMQHHLDLMATMPPRENGRYHAIYPKGKDGDAIIANAQKVTGYE